MIKVKEPLEAEYSRLRGQIVFTYFHLAGAPLQLTEALLASRTTAIAYETIEDVRGGLPLLAPMSAVAGAMAPLVGAYYLAKFNGGRGTLLARLLGTAHGKVVIVGDGVVGRHACDAASGLGAAVVVLGLSPQRAKEFESPRARVRYLASTAENLTRELHDTDVLIGGVLRRGARAPHVVSEAMVKRMPPGSVIVDVSIDSGWLRRDVAADVAFASGVRPARRHPLLRDQHAERYPRTSTLALTEATLPYALTRADRGMAAAAEDAGLAKGVNTHAGRITYRAVADALSLSELYAELRTAARA